MKSRLDPWPADYEAPIQLDDDAPAIGATVDEFGNRNPCSTKCRSNAKATVLGRFRIAAKLVQSTKLSFRLRPESKAPIAVACSRASTHSMLDRPFRLQSATTHRTLRIDRLYTSQASTQNRRPFGIVAAGVIFNAFGKTW